MLRVTMTGDQPIKGTTLAEIGSVFAANTAGGPGLVWYEPVATYTGPMSFNWAVTDSVVTAAELTAGVTATSFRSGPVNYARHSIGHFIHHPTHHIIHNIIHVIHHVTHLINAPSNTPFTTSSTTSTASFATRVDHSRLSR